MENISSIKFTVTDPGFDIMKSYGTRIENFLGYRGESFFGKAIEFEVECNGKKFNVKAGNQAELRTAIQATREWVNDEEDNRQHAVLSRLAGVWKDRTDLPDFAALRGEWDRVGG